MSEFENPDTSMSDTSMFEVTMLMADAAQVQGGKLYILGGGISSIPARPTQIALAILIRVRWDKADVSHKWVVELLDEDFAPVMSRDRPVLLSGEFIARRPDNATPGIPLEVPLAINFPALPVEGAKRYSWRLSIENQSEPQWRVSFGVRPAQTA